LKSPGTLLKIAIRARLAIDGFNWKQLSTTENNRISLTGYKEEAVADATEQLDTTGWSRVLGKVLFSYSKEGRSKGGNA
jgi:NAD(P)H-nitrite reductase large subunit